MFRNVKHSRRQNAENYKSPLDSLLPDFSFFGHINTTSKGCQEMLHVHFVETSLLFNGRDGNTSQFVISDFL